MTTAYNLHNKMSRARGADRPSRVDPGSGGIITVTPMDRGTVVLTTTGARTLEAPAGLGLGTKMLVCSTAAGATCNGTTVNAGDYAEFMVTVDASGNNQWIVSAST